MVADCLGVMERSDDQRGSSASGGTQRMPSIVRELVSNLMSSIHTGLPSPALPHAPRQHDEARATEERLRAAGRRKLEEFKMRKQALLAKTSSTTGAHVSFASQAAREEAPQGQFPNLASPGSTSPPCTCCAACAPHKAGLDPRRLASAGGLSPGQLHTPPSQTRLAHRLSVDSATAHSHMSSAKSAPNQYVVEDAISAVLHPAAGDAQGPGRWQQHRRSGTQLDASPTDHWLSGLDVSPVHHAPAGLAALAAPCSSQQPPLPPSSRLQCQHYLLRQVLGSSASLSTLPQPRKPASFSGPPVPVLGDHLPQQDTAPAGVDPFVDVLLSQVKELMNEKRDLQRRLKAMTNENNALQELVGYLVEHQSHESDTSDQDD